MKKIYNAPSQRLYKISIRKMIAESIYITSDLADDSYLGGCDAKEDIFGRKNIWDEEW